MQALIPAAGHGTRFLPVTRVVPKEMLPIGSKPAVQLIAEEAVAAGATAVTFVISPGKELIRRYFEEEPLSVPIRWAYQNEQKGLGHAVLQAADLFADEKDPVLVLLGDAVVTGGTASTALAEVSRSRDGASVVGLERVPREKISRYGVAAGTQVDAWPYEAYALTDLVEKPAPEQAPSDLAVAGRYLLDPSIFRLLADQKPGHAGEIQLTDAIRRLMADKPVFGCRYPGRRHDIGNPAGYLETLNAYAH